MNKEDIILTARSWIGTKFHHQGRIKQNGNNKGGCDCIGLIIGIAKELGINIYDESGYSKLPNNYLLEEKLNHYLIKKDIKDISISDIALFRISEFPQHVGIISNYDLHELGIIHSFLPAKKVVEHHLNYEWKERLVAVYNFPTLKK
ncbi:MAG: hypothetical protein J0H68_07975 [Sphingobacteriia bacterium]|nr:hypothetical protein [Sphingobacteriia bacterium]